MVSASDIGSGAVTIVTFEPLPYGIGTTLKKAGYRVQEVQSGVDVMQAVASHATGLIICGPASDAEHRRLLTAAIRSRFSSLPIVYASTHAGDPRALDGAKAEGAHEVLQVPLPEAGELDAFLARFDGIKKQPVPDIAEIEGLGQLKQTNAVNTSQPSTLVDSISASASQETSQETSNEGASESASGADKPAKGALQGDPKAKALNPQASQTQGKEQGEIGSLLLAISPFMWGLEDAARWAEALEKEGNIEAMQHAKTLHLLSGLLKQLKERIDDKKL